MGKFAGFLKRIKKAAGLGTAVLNVLNSVYKSIKPFSEDIVGALPFGSYINKGLDVGSKLIDKVQPYAQKYLIDEDNKDDLENLSNNIKRHAGNVAQKALNTYMDVQDELYDNKGNLSLKDYSSKMLFGKPLNAKNINDDFY